MVFNDRCEAGRMLTDELKKLNLPNPYVLAMPRGGTPVALEVAKELNCPLDVLVVRKLGAPSDPELGIGALAPDNIKVLDQLLINQLNISSQDLDLIEKKESVELNRRIKEYRQDEVYPDFTDKTVILIDDGLATGVTALAAYQWLIKHNPAKVIIAIPVCSQEAHDSLKASLRSQSDQLVCLAVPFDFTAVAMWYLNFNQVSDNEVKNILSEAKHYHIPR